MGAPRGSRKYHRHRQCFRYFGLFQCLLELPHLAKLRAPTDSTCIGLSVIKRWEEGHFSSSSVLDCTPNVLRLIPTASLSERGWRKWADSKTFPLSARCLCSALDKSLHSRQPCGVRTTGEANTQQDLAKVLIRRRSGEHLVGRRGPAVAPRRRDHWLRWTSFPVRVGEYQLEANRVSTVCGRCAPPQDHRSASFGQRR